MDYLKEAGWQLNGSAAVIHGAAMDMIRFHEEVISDFHIENWD
jgi:hypothetical protein